MRTNNPVLSRPDAFTPAQSQGYPQGFQADAYYNPQQANTYPQPGYAPQGFGQPQDAFGRPPQGPAAGRMTIDDVIAKTAMLTLILVAAAGVAWLLLPVELLFPVAIVGSIVAFVTVMIVAARRNVSVPAVVAYALVEGLVIGAWSKVFEFMYPGIVMQAVIGTIVATFVVLGAYKFLGVRVSGRLAKIVVASIIGYAVVSLLNLVLLLVGVNLGWAAIGASANVTTIGLAEKEGVRIGFSEFMRFGFPAMVISVTIASIFLSLHVLLGEGRARVAGWLVAVPLLLWTLLAARAKRRRA